MPTNNGRRHSDSRLNDYQSPIDVSNLHVIGSSPPGYRAVDEPPLKKFVREVNRIWVAPMLAGLPAWFEHWWKKGKNKHLNGATATVATPALNNYVSLSPGQLFTVQVAFAVLTFLLLAFLWYAWLEQRKRAHDEVLDISKHNLQNNNMVLLVPKRKYLMDLTKRWSSTPDTIKKPLKVNVGSVLPELPRVFNQYPPYSFRTKELNKLKELNKTLEVDGYANRSL